MAVHRRIGARTHSLNLVVHCKNAPGKSQEYGPVANITQNAVTGIRLFYFLNTNCAPDVALSSKRMHSDFHENS